MQIFFSFGSPLLSKFSIPSIPSFCHGPCFGGLRVISLIPTHPVFIRWGSRFHAHAPVELRSPVSHSICLPAQSMQRERQLFFHQKLFSPSNHAGCHGLCYLCFFLVYTCPQAKLTPARSPSDPFPPIHPASWHTLCYPAFHLPLRTRST